MCEHLGVGAGVLLHRGEEHIGQIQHDPVEHDAGNDLVDVAVGLEQAGNAAEDRAAANGEQHTRKPAPAEAERRVQAQRHAGAVLSGCTDVKEAHLVGKQDRQRAHQQRRGLDERVAEIFQLRGGAVVGHKVLDDRKNGLARTRGIDEQQHKVAEEQSQHDAQEGGQQRLEAAAFENILFHAFTSSLFAPAM